MSTLRLLILALVPLILVGCGIPPVDTTYISTTPASDRSFAIAQKAVRACAGMPDKNKVRARFQQAGFRLAEQKIQLPKGRQTTRLLITAPDPGVSVLFHGSSCYVGLVGMTPQQSYALASIWVDTFDAKPNSAYGDGLSDHVSGAWRRFFTEPARIPDRAAYDNTIFIAAYKTWPHGPYDPQRNVSFDIDDLFPDVPGSAVKLTYVHTCKPHVKTGPNSGMFLPC